MNNIYIFQTPTIYLLAWVLLTWSPKNYRSITITAGIISTLLSGLGLLLLLTQSFSLIRPFEDFFNQLSYLFGLDPFSAVLMVFINIVFGLYVSLHTENSHHALTNNTSKLLLLIMTGVNLLCILQDLYIFGCVTLLLSLIWSRSFLRHEKQSNNKNFKYSLHINYFADLLFILAIVGYKAELGNTNYLILLNIEKLLPIKNISVINLIFILSVALKVKLFPLNIWLTGQKRISSYIVFIISCIFIPIVFYLIARLSHVLSLTAELNYILLFWGLLTAIAMYGSGCNIWNKHKWLITTSVAHLGFLIFCIGINAYLTAFYLSLSHGLVKLLLLNYYRLSSDESENIVYDHKRINMLIALSFIFCLPLVPLFFGNEELINSLHYTGSFPIIVKSAFFIIILLLSFNYSRYLLISIKTKPIFKTWQNKTNIIIILCCLLLLALVSLPYYVTSKWSELLFQTIGGFVDQVVAYRIYDDFLPWWQLIFALLLCVGIVLAYLLLFTQVRKRYFYHKIFNHNYSTYVNNKHIFIKTFSSLSKIIYQSSKYLWQAYLQSLQQLNSGISLTVSVFEKWNSKVVITERVSWTLWYITIISLIVLWWVSNG